MNPNYAGHSGGPSTFNTAAPLGTSTMASTFTGATVIGTWNVLLADDGGNLEGFGANLSFASYDLVINFSAASSPSTTTLSASPTNMPFTSGTSSSDTLTATVTSGATGTLTFKDGGTNLVCTGGNPATISGSVAHCVTTFASEGLHGLSAVYGGDSTFVGSTGAANIYAMNHATNPSGTKYCNTGALNANGQSDSVYTSTTPYPSVIDIGDGTSNPISGTVATVSLQLTNFSTATGALDGVHMLLVSPDGTHAFDFFSGIGEAASAGNYTFQDGSAVVPTGPISPGTYGPTADGQKPDIFTPQPPAPAPQLPGSFVYAPQERQFDLRNRFFRSHPEWPMEALPLEWDWPERFRQRRRRMVHYRYTCPWPPHHNDRAFKCSPQRSSRRFDHFHGDRIGYPGCKYWDLYVH